jgi:hypothetical protein
MRRLWLTAVCRANSNSKHSRHLTGFPRIPCQPSTTRLWPATYRTHGRSSAPHVDSMVSTVRRTRGAATLVATMALALGIVLAGCGSGSNTAAPAVPGGAPVEARAGTPEYCSALVASGPVRELGDALAGLAQAPPSNRAAVRVRGAAHAFATIGQKARGKLAHAFTSTAADLQALASRGMTNRTAADRVDNSLDRLGRELQGKCAFPVG